MKNPKIRSRSTRNPLRVEPLEDRIAPAAAFPQFVDPHPSAGNQFGFSVTVLTNGNVVITAPFDDTNANDGGAIYLYSGATGQLISQVHGNHADDNIGNGQVLALSNGNFVVASPQWDNGAVQDAGAVTFGNGTTGVTGTVSSANSLVGSALGDNLGSGGLFAVGTGNYVIGSPNWHNAGQLAGAVTWGNGTTGRTGTLSSANSLVGSTNGDGVGNNITVLTNGNYVVASAGWDDGATTNVGAVTWASGATGVTGAISSTNSLIGTTAGDNVGGSISGGVVKLTNGNYVVLSPNWDDGATVDVGAVTWVDGTTGLTGTVSTGNSMVGSTTGDRVGFDALALTNGNFVVLSPNWTDGATTAVGAATWKSGSSAVSGNVTTGNSLIGSTANDKVGSGAFALTNGNYVVTSALWDNGATTDAGAATFGNGTTGTVGTVGIANSLVGTNASDGVGTSVTPLTNGSYVVFSFGWNGGVSATTWGSGTAGVSGAVSSANSLVGSTANDGLLSAIVPLTNGNYVVLNPYWDNGGTGDTGAATWGDGTAGATGVISAANSLVGSSAGDQVGAKALALTNGNYVVLSPNWDNGATQDVGAATWADGTTGISGALTTGVSLVGTSSGDQVGTSGAVLTNGKYVVQSPNWDNGATADVGAVTLGNGTTGTTGTVSSGNSLIGSTANDQVGIETSGPAVIPLPNGNYIVLSPNWDNGATTDAGAITFGSGTTGVTGTITSANSGLGQLASGGLQFAVLDTVNSNFFGIFLQEGAVRVGAFSDGFAVNLPDTTVTFTTGSVVVLDVNGGTSDDSITIARFGANIRISDPDNILSAGPGTIQVDQHTVDIVFASVTGGITFDLLAGTDVLTLDFSAGNFIPLNGITFLGGAGGGPGDDSIEIAPGAVGQSSFTFSSATDGDAFFVNFGQVFFQSIGSLFIGGTATDLNFGLPLTGSNTTLADDGTGGNSMSRLSGTAIPTVDFLTPSNSLSVIPGGTTDQITVAALPDFSTALNLGVGFSPFQTVTFSGAVTLGPGFDLAAYATNLISLSSGSTNLTTTGSGGISLISNRSITGVAGAHLGATAGIISLAANTDGAGTGAFVGIDLNGSTIQVTGAGAVSLDGTGGTSTGGLQHGVYLHGGALVSGGTGPGGATLVTGHGGITAGGNGSIGVLIEAGTITSVGGNVSVTGFGGNGAVSGEASGVYMNDASALITSAAGSVTVNGTGGNGVTSTNTGVDVRFGSMITSVSGDVTVTGLGGSNPASDNPGTRAIGGGVITSGPSGVLTVTGGAGAGVQTGTTGLVVTGAGSIIGGNGPQTTVIGTADFSGVLGMLVVSGGVIGNGGTATLDINTDTLAIAGGGSINGGTGITTVTPRTVGLTVDLGGSDVFTGSRTLGISASELSAITAGILNIGGESAGLILVTSAVSTATNLNLSADQAIVGAGSIALSPGKSLTLTCAGTTSLTGALTVPGTLVVEAGTGSLSLLNASNDFGSVTVTNGGFVDLRDDSGFDLTAAAIGNLLRLNSAGAITQSGQIIGTGGVTKLGAGTLAYTQNNTYAGTTTISAGTLEIQTFSPVVDGSIDLNGGTLAYNTANATQTTSPALTISNGSTIDVAGGKTVTITSIISGPGGLTKTGGGTLVLGNQLNSFGPAPLNISGGTVSVASDGALGDAANSLVFQTSTLQVTSSFISGRNITLNGAAVFQVDTTSLTLIGTFDGAGTSTVSGTGQVFNSIVYTGGDAPSVPKKTTVVGEAAVTYSGGTALIHLVDGNPNKIDTIEFTTATPATSLVIKSTTGAPVTINRIIVTDPNQTLGTVNLGPNVTLGDGVPDSVPDLQIAGKVSNLNLTTINANALITIGTKLPYDAPGGKTPDTYNNKPNLTIGSVNGPGVIFDITGNSYSAPGGTGTTGGGGLGKVVIGAWNFPGAIRTTQSIGSVVFKTGDCQVVFSVDKFHVGLLTTAGIGSMSVPKGTWASTGSIVEGGVKKMSVKEFADGADITAGSIDTFSVAGSFAGGVLSQGAMKNITVGGSFKGSIQAKSIGKLTAEYFDGTTTAKDDTYGDPARQNIVCTDGNLGMITAKPHDLDKNGIKNYEIVVSGSMAGITVMDAKIPSGFVGIDKVTVQAGSIGATTVKLGGNPAGIAVRDTVYESNATIGAITTTNSVINSMFAAATNIAQVTVGGNMTQSKILAGTFLGDDAALGGVDTAADQFSKSGTIAGVKVTGAFTSSTIAAGVNSVDGIYGNSDDVLATDGTAPTGKATAIGVISLGAGSGSVGMSPASAHSNAILGLSLKSFTASGTAVKPLPGKLPIFLDVGTAGEDLADVLVRIMS